MTTSYLVGDPAAGPFAGFTATGDDAARRYVADNYGPVLDVVDWTGEDGKPVDLFIVAAETAAYDLPEPGADSDPEPDPGFWDRLEQAQRDRVAAYEAEPPRCPRHPDGCENYPDADHPQTGYRGCTLAARNASYWHSVPYDFADRTDCGLPLAGTGLSESHVTAAMTEHPACSAARRSR